MVSFDWYIEVPHTENLTQGDIFFNFPVPIIEYYDKYPFFRPKWTKKDVVLITQACDIEQGKTTELTFCPIVPAEKAAADLMSLDVKNSRDNQWKNGGKKEEGPIILDFTKESTLKKARNKINEIRKGELTSLHLLNETTVQTENMVMNSKVVLLKDTYQLPLKTVLSIAHDAEAYPHRLRLLPPYREHLAQAFASVYSRIGLPKVINHRELRLNFPPTIEFPYEKPKMEE